jgi:hypothetical protein
LKFRISKNYKTTFWKQNPFPFSDKGKETSTLLVFRLALSKGPSIVGVSHLSPEDGNIQFPKVVISGF